VIVLDTHALVWWADGGAELSVLAKKAIDGELADGDGLLLVSSISAWEIALLVRKGRLVLSTDVGTWLESVADVDAVRFVPVDNQVAVQSTQLPDPFHADPADRMIVALARRVSSALVTADARIRAYRHVRTIW